MTTYQQKIVDYIRDKGVVNCADICREFNIEIDDDSKKRNLSRKSMELYKEIESINNDPTFNQVIIWDTKSNYWLARNKTEVDEFVNRIYHQQAINKLVKMYRLVRKVRKNGQGDLTTYNAENGAIEFVKTFVDDLLLDEEIERLEKENNEIENDERKYVNGRYEKMQQNIARLEELRKCQNGMKKRVKD